MDNKRNTMNTYKATLHTALAIMTAATVASCDLVTPGDIINPNVDEETFVNTPNAMATWVNGTNSRMATTVATFVELTELISDDYFNNYSMTSQVFDTPTLLYTDADVTRLQRGIGTLREMALKGLTTVADADHTTTRAQRFNLRYVEGYAYLLAGENFVGLPVADGGDIVDWKGQLQLAISTFLDALTLTDNATDRAFINTLVARAYYRLGSKDSAVSYAQAALACSADFVKQVTFDGENGVTNSFQEYVYGADYGFAFQPLPRLDFLDPKYFYTDDVLEQRPICIAKAEEPYLIMAEAALADGRLDEARTTLHTLLALVAQRPVQHDINDQMEGRDNGGYRKYPNSSEYRVAASMADSLRSGLVLDRQRPNLISVPYISGTSVTDAMVDHCATQDELLELVYLLRQEIFFGEGRRSADLGIRLPVCEVEAANTPTSEGYTTAVIPPFIPTNQDMDAFTLDEAQKTVVIKYNMNRVIVENKTSAYVVPFIH